MRWNVAVVGLATLSLAGCNLVALNTQKVGPQPQGVMAPNGLLVRGVGQKVEFPGRPVDMVFTPDHSLIAVKDLNLLRLLDPVSWKQLGSIAVPSGASLTGIVSDTTGKKVYISNSTNLVVEFDITDPANPKELRKISVPGPGGKGNSFPCGMDWLVPDQKLLVCLSINNTLGVLNVETGKIESEIPVGIAPYAVVYSPKTKRALVTNQGGSRAKEGEETAPSAGTETPVDKRGIAARGSVTILQPDNKLVIGDFPCGLQPSAAVLAPDQNTVYVAETNNDSVFSISLSFPSKPAEIDIKPDSRLPFGSMPAALAVSSDAKTLYVANSGNNAVAVVDLATKKPVGFIPTDWNPYGLLLDQRNLYILNNKGIGARDPAKDGKPHNSHDKSATIQKVALPSQSTLAAYTKQVLSDAQVPQILAAYERSTNTTATPVPIPAKLGEPSLIKHVVYVIKENRTYDQLFGDMKIGDGDPKLCQFGIDVTPNQHALAENYVLLDNYYCNGVLSADGHSWATEGNLTPYLNRAFGGFTRSYTFGDDPITYSSSGFIWDGILAAGLSFRNYGEFNYSELPEGKSGKQVWLDYVAKKPQTFSHNIGVANVRRYSNLDAPGWNMNIPDQLRMDVFEREFREFEKNGNFPNFVVLYLPQDHTGGAVSARSNVADNDLAVGRLIDVLSHSQYWKDTAVFINEDDPQAGVDHVDGHRSICLVVSPYTYKKGVVNEFYNQTSVLRTIGQIFGIAPMNQRDASSTLMSACFSNTPNPAPYRAITPKTPLDEFPKTAEMSAPQLAMFQKVKALDLSRHEVDNPADMDLLNRWVWHSQKGWNVPYPVQFAGPHGKGLAARGLTHSKISGDDE